MPKKKPTKRVAIIVDHIGGGGRSREEEVDAIKCHVKRALKEYTVIFHEPKAMTPNVDADMIVFDYGGMAMGEHSPFFSFCRTLVTWMNDHPSSLVVIGSTFTYDCGIHPELREQGLLPPLRMDSEGHWGHEPIANLLVGYMSFPYYADDDLSDMETGIQDWFKLEQPIKKTRKPRKKK